MSEITGYKVADRVDHPEHGRGVVRGITQAGTDAMLRVRWNAGNESVVPRGEVSPTPKTAPSSEDEARSCLLARYYAGAEADFARALELTAARSGGRTPGLLPEDAASLAVEEPKPQQLGLFDVAAPAVTVHRRRGPYGGAR
jgi:hypothetical protein